MHQIIQTVTKPTEDDDLLIAGQPTRLTNNTTPIKLQVDTLYQPVKSRMQYKLPGPSYCKDFRLSDKRNTLETAIKRYSKETFRVKNPEMLGSRIFAKMSKTAFKGGQLQKVTRDDILLAAAETCERMQDRGTAAFVTELIEDENKFHSVNFFMKQIIKFKPNLIDGPNESLKAGQGIAAHSKEANALMCVGVRALEKAFLRSLNDNIILANGHQEKAFGHDFATRSDFSSPNLEGDGEEFDCSQNNVVQWLERKLFLEAGFDEEIVDLWFAHKSMRFFTSANFFRMLVEEKKDSGYADTLFGNTYWTLCCVCWCVIWTMLHVLMIKGDDNGINAAGLKIDEVALKELSDMGCRWKFSFTSVMSFCNFFYTPVGALPDVFQRFTKLFSRKFSDYDEVKKYHTSMIDQMSLVDTFEKKDSCILAVSQYYGLQPEATRLLFDNFMTLIREGPNKLFERMTYAEYYIETNGAYKNLNPAV